MDDGNRPKEFSELLNRLVLDEQKVVTVAFLLRHTPLDVFQIQSLLQHFLDSNSNVSANYYLLGPLKADFGKKQCAIVRGAELANAKRHLAKVDICNIFSVQQANRTESLEDVFKTDWLEQNVSAVHKGFLKDSEEVSAAQPNCSSLAISPISLPKDKDEDGGGEGAIGEGDREAEESAELKRPTRKPFRRPILFTPISKEADFKTYNPKMERNRPSGKGRIENDAENSAAHPPVKRPMAQPIKREAKVAKMKAAENGGSKQTTIFNFFKK